MLPPDRVQATAGGEPVPVVDSVHRAIARSPLLLRPVLALFAVAFLPWLLAPISRLSRGALHDGLALRGRVRHVDLLRRSTSTGRPPAAPAAMPGACSVGWWLAIAATPFAIAAVAHVRPLSRWFVPCRTVAWALLWSFPVGILIIQAWWQHAQVGAIAIWVIAAAVIGWRAAKGSQEARMFGPDGVLAAYADPNAAAAGPARRARQPGRTAPGRRRPASGRPGPAGREHRPGRPGRARARPVRRAGAGRRPGVRGPLGPQAAAAGRAGPVRAADHPRGRAGRAGRDGRARAGQGAGALDLRLDRGGPPPGRGRLRRRQADAALRLPRPARHRQDHRGPGDRQDLLRVRAARERRRGRGAALRPGRRVPGRDRDQDQRADRLGPRPGAVHRRGLQPGQRGRRAERPVRRRGGADAAQAGRGRPRAPDHHPGRVREADRGVPGHQPRPGVAVRDPHPVPDLLHRGALRPGRAAAAGQAGAAGGRRQAGPVADARGGGPPPHHRRARQRPVRPHAA